ncbi:MAG: PoNi-like cognate immunity protein [Turicibacter sp.]|nr:PoNi-like cognate immunity protein [Turicibacter sp.]
MRDPKRNAEYFQAYIAREQHKLQKYEEWLENGEIAESRITFTKWHFYMIRKNIWFAKYSKGDPISTLVEPYEEMLHIFLNLDFLDGVEFWYEDVLTLLSLGVLLDSDMDGFRKLFGMAQEIWNDWLCRYLAHSRMPEVEVPDKLLAPRFFLHLHQGLRLIVIKQSADYMLTYLKKTWYQGNRDSAWHGRHQRDKDGKFDYDRSTYCGYWSFESGAVAKILGFDDSVLKNAPYYPYNLVHFGDEK